jgi:hypothetical protein
MALRTQRPMERGRGRGAVGGAETNRAVEVNCLLDGGAVRRHEPPHLALHARDARRAAHQHHLPRKGGARGANHLRVHAGQPG